MIENSPFPRITFRDLIHLPESEQDKLVEIRNEDSVRGKMFTSHIIQLSEHRNWIDLLATDRCTRVWATYLDTQLIGAVSMSNISHLHQTTDWAFYLTTSQQGTGIGGVVEYLFLEHAFSENQFEKVNCAVMASNVGVVRMHQKFGFQIEGTRRQNIVKLGAREDVLMLGLLRLEWLEHRKKRLPLIERIYAAIPPGRRDDET